LSKDTPRGLLEQKFLRCVILSGSNNRLDGVQMARRSRIGHANDRSKDKQSGSAQLFGEIANSASRQAGRAPTFIAAVALVLIWAVTGPLFGYSDTWQLVINTGTTIVTFLMVFLIQNSQNRDGAAIQVKLDELIRVSMARNSFVGIEHLTDEELEDIREKCERRAKAEKIGEKEMQSTEQRTQQAADRVSD
jgi:low affinity Fe/Cu permease